MNISGIAELKADISADKPKSVYVIFGNDGYLKQIYTEKLINTSFSGDAAFNLQKFTDDSALSQVYDAVWQYPLMSDLKCVVLTDFDYQKCTKDDFDLLCSMIKEPCDTTVFILNFNRIDVDRRNDRTKKLFAAMGKEGRIVCLDHMTRGELTRTLCGWAKRRGCVLSSITAGYMIETCGEDSGVLKTELEKLCAYAVNREITREDIDKVCIKTVECSVYNLSKAITAARVSQCMKIIDELFFLKIEPMFILSTLYGVYVDMFRVLSARNAGLKYNSVIDDFGYKNREFVVSRASDSLRMFDENKLRLSFSALMAADSALKTNGALPRDVLEGLVVELCCIASSGRAAVDR